jgi:glycosyltransferase involved in cell wall biosynthesis
MDIFHIHWPDAVVMGKSQTRAFIKFLLFLTSVITFRTRGTKIVYSVHNIGSHDERFPLIERLLWSTFLPNVDVFIHMNSDSLLRFQQLNPQTASKKHVVIFLPHYAHNLKLEGRNKETIRARFGFDLDKHIFLSFGLLRPYKGLETLIRAFGELSDENARLIIAGRPHSAEYATSLRLLCAKDSRISLLLRFVPDDELTDLLIACDTVVMAHRKVNNSGVAMMALSVNRPLIAPALGALPEMAATAGTEWFTFFDDLTSDVLRSSILKTKSTDGKRPNLSSFEPGIVTAQLEELFLTLSRIS